MAPLSARDRLTRAVRAFFAEPRHPHKTRDELLACPTCKQRLIHHLEAAGKDAT